MGGPADQQQDQGRLIWLRDDRPHMELWPIKRGDRIGHGGLVRQRKRVQTSDMDQMRSPGQPGVEVQAAVHLDVAREDLVRRLLSRRRGLDDTEAVIEHRLQVYLDKTVPLLEYYAGREWMFTVDGAQPPDVVHAEILSRLQKLADFATWTRPRIATP